MNHLKNAIEPKVKLFLSSSDVEGLFGGGKCLLLEAIEKEGSIQKAALSLGRSYRKAWGDIRRAEEGLGQPLVIRTRGGSHGGGRAELTLFCKQLISAWEEYRSEVIRCARESYQKKLMALIERTDS
jgi:molybdate transport system regulatory protein